MVMNIGDKERVYDWEERLKIVGGALAMRTLGDLEL
jgi:hypothetical protein